jgi:alpha-tubulin suppressor-like RCC1 family protein
LKPTLLDLDTKRLKDIKCGLNHSVFLFDTHLTIYGDAKMKSKERIHTIKFTFDSVVNKIDCGWNHTVLLYDDKVEIVGRNQHGQLCSSDKTLLMNLLNGRVREVVCGSEHTLLLSDCGLKISGWNEHGNCGMETESDVCIDGIVELEGIVKMYAGYAVSVVAVG